ncbi:MAG: ergothioneine biosynthesis protein EgtB [Oligoflexales bacterium]
MTSADVNLSNHSLDPLSLGDAFLRTRRFTERLCSPLAIEDFGLQSMTDVSPAKWHLAHASWFFEKFVLMEYFPHYRPYSNDYLLLFNSYYHAAGKLFERKNRGLLSRPTVAEVYAYRQHVDNEIKTALEYLNANFSESLAKRILLGIHHEQQHQELILMDQKYNFAQNPMLPTYLPARRPTGLLNQAPVAWLPVNQGVHIVGHNAEAFCFDNEMPAHRVYIGECFLSSHLVTNLEFIEFMEDGGYRDPLLWLSEGWQWVTQNNINSPLYWYKQDTESWEVFTLHGLQSIQNSDPVCHVSFFEADAFARWAGSRLPTESEWETVARHRPIIGHLLDDEAESANDWLEPSALDQTSGASSQFYGDTWEWTASPYSEYPGFQPFPGMPREYNGKFMCNQMVLRGGSSITPRSHIRPTYRNFFPPHSRWQLSGIRLARRTPLSC